MLVLSHIFASDNQVLFLSTAAEFGSSQLMDADVLVISDDRCSDRKVYGNILDKSMFCAGYLEGGIDSCQVSGSVSRTTGRVSIRIANENCSFSGQSTTIIVHF